ncbi:MAG: HAMP domain-containing histidine kinase [Phycisphaerales bacterium]|nr:HAMP domain-containing histidine kinase [Phycisphaerales bacterium]
MTTIEDIRDWFGELSLATKCLLLVGAATALVIVIALSLPLLRMNGLVGASELELARTVYATWINDNEPGVSSPEIKASGATIRSLTRNQADAELSDNRFLARAMQKFGQSTNRVEFFDADWNGWNRVYRYARAVRDNNAQVTGVVLLEHRADGAGWLLVVNLLYVMVAGAVVLAVALVVYATIISRLILSPVASLQKTAELVRDGDLETRCQIDTGDEFEELAETINLMLAALSRQRDQLRDANKAMDIKLSELAEANTALFESARLKGEFLASVSHELRTPLNAIIGFAELLLEIARKEIAEAAEDDMVPTPGPGREINQESGELNKRERYLVNIVSAGRTLLEMIESLLEMAKIEAGRVELNLTQMNLGDTCQALVGLIHPLARKKGIAVRLDIAHDLPLIETDTKKFQQIVFNLLSNAVKFTGNDGTSGEITLRAELMRDDGSGDERIRISVIDNGEGIAPEDQKRIFDKFQQVDSSHTRSHTGTGLGLAIVMELTRLLQGEMLLVSELGSGSMFSLIIPTSIDRQEFEEAKLEAKFRGALRPPPQADQGEIPVASEFDGSTDDQESLTQPG